MNSNQYIVTEYLQYSIEEYLTLTPPARMLSFAEVAVQMLLGIKEIHDVGYLHRDIKPDNFRVHNHQVRPIDLGIVQEYITDGKHKSIGNFGFAGTPMFGSIKALEGNTQSRRDDLEVLGYTILFLRDKWLLPGYKEFKEIED